MGKIYGQQWIAKNGAVPDELWLAQIGSLTSDQMTNVCNSLVSRCSGGNTWPPSLAEFVALVADAGGGLLGLTTSDVMAEYKRWRNESYRYASSELFPWSQPVLYQICTELRRAGVERQMTQPELERHAASQLAKWEKHLAEGRPIPPVRKQIAAPRHPSGPTPAQILMEQYRSRKAAGLI
ncbi:TPA: replication protein [Salmonella enterica subsp. enterica serovar Lehrte]|nr:replication protein [Salmonella enterica subsp. enterica serovar Ank]EHY9927979.1 replication protein [Salmonella enterica subsp. enterica serovar Ank]HCM2492404.1 replication protein [Salmonella enterica subsp. enterica serovar Lehrte]